MCIVQADIEEKLESDTEPAPSESDMDDQDRQEELANPDTLAAKKKSGKTLRAEKHKRKLEAASEVQSENAKEARH